METSIRIPRGSAVYQNANNALSAEIAESLKTAEAFVVIIYRNGQTEIKGKMHEDYNDKIVIGINQVLKRLNQ